MKVSNVTFYIKEMIMHTHNAYIYLCTCCTLYVFNRKQEQFGSDLEQCYTHSGSGFGRVRGRRVGDQKT